MQHDASGRVEHEEAYRRGWQQVLTLINTLTTYPNTANQHAAHSVINRCNFANETLAT